MHMRRAATAVLMVIAIAAGACAKKTPPFTQAPPPPVTQPPAVTPARPATPAQRVDDILPVPPQPLVEDTIANRSLDDLNRDSPLRPAFFGLDSADLDDAGRAIVSANSDLLKKYPTWMVTVEGHCDERGTAEYNLGLGERRAMAVRTYLVSLGVASERVRSVSYGKEFPFDPGHTDEAWAKNRRGHFVITAK